MHKISNSFWLGPLLSGVLTYVAVCQVSFITSWICYVPLFISLSNAPLKGAFKRGFLFGLVFSCFAFFWMIPGAERFTGYSIFYGFGVFIVSALVTSAYYACIIWSFATLKKSETPPLSVIVNGLLIASVFCLAEALRMLVFPGLPWFDIHSGIGLTANLYSIQPASVFGIHFLTFMVVLINYLAGNFIYKGTYTKLYIPTVILVLFMLSGWFILGNFNNKATSNAKPFRVGILAENISSDIKWNDNTGNILVQRLLDLNRSAVTMKPDMILWSESAIPWTYKKDDDLLKEVLRITGPAHVTHMLGINTAYRENEIFNSAYCILPGGYVAGRYDKQYLLTLIEKPISGLLMPFFSSNGYSATNDKRHAAPINTPYGKAGMLICNEAAVPAAAAIMVKEGAQFLFNMSNDGWFNDTYIVRVHFYYARLRAVESRKDLAINCNNGYSGSIKASGDIAEQEKSDDPFVKVVSIQPNNVVTTASALPYLFVYCCAAYVALIALFGKRKLLLYPGKLGSRREGSPITKHGPGK